MLVARERTPPELVGDKLRAGRLDGELFLVRTGDGQVVCSAPFSAASSPEVASVAGGQAQAIERDFELRARRELEATLQRMNRGLQLELR